ncbi:hypothetical protein BKM31_24025 [[Actinomadura] parvosata subsp. kistnae]|uniref:Right handed beta helix domain-containing protein n=1 Tax=[Actinomadura] parvosata subsp. kistnae TaxID=1909395 RepID=A0A1V0A1R4_9ACTN|nr:hypothetical protein BKM31_24025 [Nonomuraea sp. ATCC 55076]
MLAAPGVAHASAQNAVSCGDVLTSSVTLTADLVCAGGVALTVQTDDVDIDLNGHSLIGTAPGTAIQVQNAVGVTIRNGTITGFTTGLHARAYFAPVPKVTVTDVRFVGSGIQGRPAFISVSGTHSTCHLENASVYGAPGNLVVDGCRVDGSIYLFNANLSAIRHSVLSGGLLSIGQSDQGDFSANVFDDYPVDIWATESRRNVFKQNVFKNAAVAFTTTPAYTPANASVIEKNVFTGNDIGVFGKWAFSNVIVRNNVFKDNRTAGMYLENYGAIPSSVAVSGNVLIGNGHAPSGRKDLVGNPIQGGLHLVTGLEPVMRIALADNVGIGNAGRMIWAPPGMVIDGGGNQGPCEPVPNPDLTCW